MRGHLPLRLRFAAQSTRARWVSARRAVESHAIVLSAAFFENFTSSNGTNIKAKSRT